MIKYTRRKIISNLQSSESKSNAFILYFVLVIRLYIFADVHVYREHTSQSLTYVIAYLIVHDIKSNECNNYR